MKLPVPYVLAVLFWLALWQLAAFIVDSPLVLPSPITTLGALINLVMTADFWPRLALTLLRVFGGIALSVVLGAVLGVICGLNVHLHEVMMPMVTVIRTLPVVSVIILINLWVASGLVPLVVSFLVCFPMVYTNMATAIQETDEKLLEMAQVFGVSSLKVLRQIYLPATRPYFYAALMNAIGMGWKATVTAEVLANALPSVGMSLYYAKVYLETPTLFAWTVILVVASGVIEGLTKTFLKGKAAENGH